MSVASKSIHSAALLAVASLAGLCSLGGCKAYRSIEDLPVDCSVEDDYEFLPVDAFEPGENISWFPAGDPFCGDGGVSIGVEPIEGSGRCASKGAVVLRSMGCNDWGSLFGNYAFGVRDASAYEGVSFWARAPGNTGKGFTIVLDDRNTTDPTPPDPTTMVDSDLTDSNCIALPMPVGGTPTVGTTYDPGTGMVISGTTGAQPAPFQCGNGYNAVQVVTADWRFYTVPFERFTQTQSPNLVPNSFLTQKGNVPGTGLLTSAVMGMTFRMPKEAPVELWLDDLSFYRSKGWTARGDAGADAAQP